jgi:CRISPR/Cas system CSM-associated protein Csm4 (group 5 of RAMP superfamily)
MVSLSLFCPEDEEQLKVMLGEKPGDSSYELVNRGGWITSPGLGKVRKRSIYMFSEGSVFKMSADPVSGGCITLGKTDIDLSPWKDLEEGNRPKRDLHKIYRSGKALFLPLITN